MDNDLIEDLRTRLERVERERDRARQERDALEQDRGCWTGHACLACDGTGEGAGADDEMRRCPNCGGTGETWEIHKEQLRRAQAEAAAMRVKIEAAVKHFSALHVDGGGADVVDELLLEALSSQAGADLLAEIAGLREIERLAKEYRTTAMEFRTGDRLGWPESEAAIAAGKLRAAGEALFAALAELEQKAGPRPGPGVQKGQLRGPGLVWRAVRAGRRGATIVRDVMKERLAKTTYCPLGGNRFCTGAACMAWTVSWENDSEGFCAALRPTYEQEIDQGRKKHGRRVMGVQKKLLARVKQAEAEVTRLREIERLAKGFKERALTHLENRNYHPAWYEAAAPLFAALDKETTPNG